MGYLKVECPGCGASISLPDVLVRMNGVLQCSRPECRRWMRYPVTQFYKPDGEIRRSVTAVTTIKGEPHAHR